MPTALIDAHAAVQARPGNALQPVLAAIKACAREGTIAQFREADQLLDAETFASGLFAPTIKPLLEARFAAQLRDAAWIVACLSRRLAWVYDFAGDDVAAIEMIDEARIGFAALRDEEALARTLNNLGVIWIRRNDMEGAARVLDEALALADRINVPMERARVRVNYGHLCGMMGHYERGQQMLETIISSKSTTRVHTQSATRCWLRWRNVCAMRDGRMTWWRGSAAKKW